MEPAPGEPPAQSPVRNSPRRPAILGGGVGMSCLVQCSPEAGFFLRFGIAMRTCLSLLAPVTYGCVSLFRGILLGRLTADGGQERTGKAGGTERSPPSRETDSCLFWGMRCS